MKPNPPVDVTTWHDRFALWPVWATNEHGQERLIWLEPYRQRVTFMYCGFGGTDERVERMFTERNA